ncbi:MAG: hypothetical protein ABI646_03325 [Acidobacteriota bacterium]
MKKITSLIISLALFGILISAPSVDAKDGCNRVSGTGNTFATGPTTFQGTALLRIDGRLETVSVTTNLLGPPKVGDDGTLLAHTSHTFVFDDGSSFTTLDNAVLSPTDTSGLYNLNTRAAIIQGTGSFENAFGILSIHGTINFISGEVIWRFKGQLCN